MRKKVASNKVVVAGTGFPDVVQIIHDINKEEKQFLDFLGFIDDNVANQHITHYGYKVVGGFDWIQNREDVFVFNSIARTIEIRKSAQKRLESLGARFISLIHPSVTTDFTEIGSGTLVAKNVYLEAHTKIGNHSIIGASATVGHDSSIGNCCFVGHGCHIQGNVEVKDFCFIGAGTTIYPDRVVEEYTTLGLNSVLIRDTQKGEVISAAPSRRIK